MMNFMSDFLTSFTVNVSISTLRIVYSKWHNSKDPLSGLFRCRGAFNTSTSHSTAPSKSAAFSLRQRGNQSLRCFSDSPSEPPSINSHTLHHHFCWRIKKPITTAKIPPSNSLTALNYIRKLSSSSILRLIQVNAA
jgi:hypothetical protein